MSNQILVPSLGESVTEATVSKWLKQVGEKVGSDEPLVELETDKVNVEVPAPQAGTLSAIKVKEGDTVEVGALLGEISAGKTQSNENESLLTESNDPPNIEEKKIKNLKYNLIKIPSSKSYFSSCTRNPVPISEINIFCGIIFIESIN